MARRTGPPPIPNEIKRRRGNPGKRSLPDESKLQIVRGTTKAPASPRPLGKAGSAMWRKVWADGHAWISPTSDLFGLCLLCEAHDERQVLASLLEEDPSDVRQRAQLRALDKQIWDGLQHYGFTPADRTRLGVAEVRVEDDLAAFRKRHA